MRSSKFTKKALDEYLNAPIAVQKSFRKQMKLLVDNQNYPSLHTKKYNESENIWQARINRDWRFYFKIIDDTYLILKIIPHPK